jgi:hypothetical protein
VSPKSVIDGVHRAARPDGRESTVDENVPVPGLPLVESSGFMRVVAKLRLPIEDAVEAFRLAQDKSKGVFRVVVEP